MATSMNDLLSVQLFSDIENEKPFKQILIKNKEINT